MIIQTERLTLRPLTTKDFEAAHPYLSDPENTELMMFFPCDDEEETMDFLKRCDAEWKKESPDFYEFAVLLGETLIGHVTVYKVDEKTGELGWVINKRFWGKGYATEAALAIKEFAFRIGFTRVIAECDARNAASAAVMKKIGLAFEKEQVRTYPKTLEQAPEFLYSVERK